MGVKEVSGPVIRFAGEGRNGIGANGFCRMSKGKALPVLKGEGPVAVCGGQRTGAPFSRERLPVAA